MTTPLTTSLRDRAELIIQDWRTQVLDLILKAVFALGTLAFIAVVAVNRANIGEMFSLLLIYTIIYLGLGVLTFLKQIPYSIRGGAFLALLYLLGTIGLIQSGLSGDGRVFLLAFTATAALLFGRMVGFVAIALALLTLITTGWLFTSGSITIPIEIQANTTDGSAWITGTLVQLMLILLLVLSTTYLLNRLAHLLNDNQAIMHQLEQTQQQLELQVAERTNQLTDALTKAEQQLAETTRLANELASQREVMRELSVPVIPVTERILVMPLIGALDDQRLQQAQEQALRAIQRNRTDHLVIDVTGVAVIDTHVVRGLINVVQASQLLGSQVTLVGIRPEVAQTIVSLGIHLGDLRTKTNLNSALRGLLTATPNKQHSV
jgi:rsbT co-antagonist protein RsbR